MLKQEDYWCTIRHSEEDDKGIFQKLCRQGRNQGRRAYDTHARPNRSVQEIKSVFKCDDCNNSVYIAYKDGKTFCFLLITALKREVVNSDKVNKYKCKHDHYVKIDHKTHSCWNKKKEDEYN